MARIKDMALFGNFANKHDGIKASVGGRGAVSVATAPALRLAAALCAALLAAFVALAVLTSAAYANVQMEAPTQVSDDITRVHVSKLDADTHGFLPGAKMAIINEETGEIVDEWISGNGVHQNEKNLNVKTVYVLRELEAPEHYSKVNDVRFMINEIEGQGIDILSNESDEFEVTGSYKINLYDKPDQGERIIEERVPGDNETPKTDTTTKTVAPKTGDETPMSTVALLVACGIVAIVLLQFPKRRLREE